MAASFVLGSAASSTYPRGYASALPSPTASLDGLLNILHRCYSAIQTTKAGCRCGEILAGLVIALHRLALNV